MWKLCASTTFEILPLSTCTLCQQKYSISKRIQPMFEIFTSAQRRWRWAFGWKDSGARVFYFFKGKVKTLRIDNIWNFSTFNMNTVPAKIFYLQRYSTDVRNLSSARRSRGSAFGWKHSLAQLFCFCNGKVKTLRIDNIWSFATFNLYTVPPKILYIQRYSTDFRNLCLSSKMLGMGIWVESLRCAGILLLQWQGENIANRQHLKFATLNLYTVPAKILYLQRYSTDFRNLCLSSKMLRVGIWVESFRCADILLLQCQGENFAHQKHLKFCHFQPVHCASKKTLSPKVFNRCSKSFLSSKILRLGIWVETFICVAILLLQWQGENFAHRQQLKFCHFQPVHCAGKNPIPPKVFNRFSKSLPQLEDFERGHLRSKF